MVMIASPKSDGGKLFPRLKETCCAVAAAVAVVVVVVVVVVPIVLAAPICLLPLRRRMLSAILWDPN